MHTRPVNPARSYTVRRQAGFSLIELLVAFTILALCLGAIYAVLSTGARSLTLSGDYARVSDWAESQLASLGHSEPLREGEHQGVFDKRFQWQQRITRADPNTSRLATTVPLYRVLLQVQWRAGGRDHRQLFETLKLGPGEGR